MANRKANLDSFEGVLEVLSHLPEDAVKKVESTMYAIAKHAVRRIVVNSPLWEGDSDIPSLAFHPSRQDLWGQLRQNITASINGVPVVSGGRLAGDVNDFGAGESHTGSAGKETEFRISVSALDHSGFDYAILMNNELTPFGEYQLGKLSASMPGQPEGGPGGHFIQRVMNFHQGKYGQMLLKTAEKILEDYDMDDLLK